MVRQLADARLVVTSRNLQDQETVEVVHEALIRHWGVLRGWMEKDRVFRAWQERLRAAKGQWEATGKDAGSLLRGAVLAEAEEKLRERREDLRDVLEFIEESIQEKEHLGQAEAARRKREIRTAWGIAVGSLVAVVISGMLVTVALVQYQRANQQVEIANQQAKIALARQLATQANSKGIQGNMQEYSTLNSSQQEFTLKLGVDSFSPQFVSLLKGIKPRIVRFSPDQRNMAVTDDKFLRLFEIDNGKIMEIVLSEITEMSFSPDGQYLTTAGQDGDVTLWNIKAGRVVMQVATMGFSLIDTAISPNGQILGIGSSSGIARIVETATGKVIHILKHDHPINSIRFSPDNHYILTGSEDGTAKVWSIRTGKEIYTLRHNTPVRLAVFTEDNKSIATVSGDTSVRIFELSELALSK
ncbi:MAG: hypothetical protein HC916_17020 [Coleofasciculaceae cyanobacterium SM2_1_6]|nr:hypothetical protein [Coleofasciculaceae cyanobacterium SM2_1_6]